MKFLFSIFLSILFALGHLFGQSPEGDKHQLIFKNVNVLPMVQPGQVLFNQDVFIENGRINRISPSGRLPFPDHVMIIDGTDQYLMPGLSEMHGHLPVATEENDTNVRETMLLYLAKGITVVRGMLGNPYHLELRNATASGDIPGPRIYTSSPSLNGRSVQTQKEAIEKVQQYKTDGYDFLKIHPGIKLNVFEKLVETAREVNIRFAGHVPVDVGITRAIEYGYWSIDHADGYVEGLVPESAEVDRSNGGFFGSNFTEYADLTGLDDLCEQTREKQVWIVPTQSLFTRWISPEPPEKMMQAKEMEYIPAKTRYAWLTGKQRILNDPQYSVDGYENFLDLRKKILKSLFQAGVGFLLGSDSPQVMNVPGFSIHHEIEALIGCGIPVEDILMSGTSNVAKFFEDSGKYGTIQPGASADLILLKDNPFGDYKTLRTPVGTVIHGKWLPKSFFDLELETIAARHKD